MPEYKLRGKTSQEFKDLDPFTQGYVEAAFWTSEEDGDNGGIPSIYGFTDLSPKTLAEIIKDCAEFQKNNADDLTEIYDNGRISGYDASSAGHDYWLTRCHHGAGFRDRDFGDVCDKLSAAADKCGSRDLYLGDDGKVVRMIHLETKERQDLELGGYTLIVPDNASGRKGRYTVYFIPSSPAHSVTMIGNEINLQQARKIAANSQMYPKMFDNLGAEFK